MQCEYLENWDGSISKERHQLHDTVHMSIALYFSAEDIHKR